MRIILVILLFAWEATIAQTSFTLPGTGNWYRVASIAGQHGYLEYVYWHSTGNNPSIAKGEIHIINSVNFSTQHHQTMGYASWNQPEFAVVNLSNTGELWVRATTGVADGTFRVINYQNVTLTNGSPSDGNIGDNGGTVTFGGKLPDNAHVFKGLVQVEQLNSNRLEIGGGDPTPTSGQATMLLHHYGVIGHQLRYSGGNLYLEAAGNGYGTSPTPGFMVGGNVGIGTMSPNASLQIGGGTGGLHAGSQGALIKPNVGDRAIMELHSPDGQNRLVLQSLSGAAYVASLDGKPLLLGGNVGIGTDNPGPDKLAVNGSIHAREVRVDVNGWPDFVFKDDYRLPPLSEVREYVKEHHHLPDVPSEKEVSENGQNLGEMNKVLLKKVEELMLYVMEQRDEVETLKAEMQRQEVIINRLLRH